MQWLRKFRQLNADKWPDRKVNPFWVVMLVLLLLFGNALLNAPAAAQQFQRVVAATFAFIIVDPQTGQERSFVCAPVPDNQEGVVTQ